MQNGYAHIKLTPESDRDLREFVNHIIDGELQFVQDPHCTLMYSPEVGTDKSFHELKEFLLPHQNMIEAKVTEFQVFGNPDQYTSGGYLVALLNSEELNNLHAKWQAIGFQHTFPEFCPHVSVVTPLPHKDLAKSIANQLNEYLMVSPLTLTFCGEEILPMRPKLSTEESSFLVLESRISNVNSLKKAFAV